MNTLYCLLRLGARDRDKPFQIRDGIALGATTPKLIRQFQNPVPKMLLGDPEYTEESEGNPGSKDAVLLLTRPELVMSDTKGKFPGEKIS